MNVPFRFSFDRYWPAEKRVGSGTAGAGSSRSACDGGRTIAGKPLSKGFGTTNTADTENESIRLWLRLFIAGLRLAVVLALPDPRRGR